MYENDFHVKCECSIMHGSANHYGNSYLPIELIGWLYLSPVFSAFRGMGEGEGDCWGNACCEAGTRIGILPLEHC
jgi:hypothetical protein